MRGARLKNIPGVWIAGFVICCSDSSGSAINDGEDGHMGDGDRERQFPELVTSHQRVLHKVCSLYAGEPGDRQDLRQEILLQLWRSFPSYRGDAAVTTWMYSVALNTALLRRRRKPEMPLPNPDALPAPAFSDPQQQREVRTPYSCIRELPAVDRASVLLHLEEHSYDEIAAVTDLSGSNVSVRIVRIKKRLQECLIARGCQRR
jgi:RNA polymerase sigma-70 factor (ECF subfamily)